MLRAMVFIDHMNFNTALTDYYWNTYKSQAARLDYSVFPTRATEQIPNAVLVKTILCVPKPDDFLMLDPGLKGYYKWVAGMSNQRCFDVVEGDYVARPVSEYTEMNINDRSTYYKVEKGTDINIAVEALTKAFNNAFDVGIFLSADTDYLPLYRTLKAIGKIVVIGAVKGQYIGKLIPNVDSYFLMDSVFFDTCLRDR